MVAALVADARREYEVGPEVDADRAEQLLAGVLGMGELPVDRDAHDIDMLFLLLAKLTYDLRLSDAEFTAVAVEAETQAVRVLRRIATGDAT